MRCFDPRLLVGQATSVRSTLYLKRLRTPVKSLIMLQSSKRKISLNQCSPCNICVQEIFANPRKFVKFANMSSTPIFAVLQYSFIPPPPPTFPVCPLQALLNGIAIVVFRWLLLDISEWHPARFTVFRRGGWRGFRDWSGWRWSSHGKSSKKGKG